MYAAHVLRNHRWAVKDVEAATAQMQRALRRENWL
jgi:hypothetical protein